MSKKSEIAVLLTCHNRRDVTLNCLRKLFACDLPINHCIEVFLVDDGSTDGTSEAVMAEFESVTLIKGTGSLYWNQGMRLAWDYAVNKSELNFSYYLLLNDDTNLKKDAIKQLVHNYISLKSSGNSEAILVGSCETEENSSSFSYGGRSEQGPVIPNGEVQYCKYINGNILFVSQSIYNIVGNLSDDYTHGMGDIDYGLRALELGIKSYTTGGYIGVCAPNAVSNWCNPIVSLGQRWKEFNSPNGLNFPEYIVFRKKFWGNQWVVFALKAYLRMLFPKLYDQLK